MSKWIVAVVLLLLSLAEIGHCGSALRFVKKIGVAAPDQSTWMSFVAFNRDGTQVASDRYSPNGSSSLTFWSFPNGRFISSLPAAPKSISKDWRYYVLHDAVVEFKTGKPLIALRKGASGEFSPDGHYLAESHFDVDGNGEHIRIIEIPGGKQLSAFDSHAPSAVAISPDDRLLASGHWDIIKLWNMRTGKRLAVFRGIGRYVSSMAFSSNGRLLASGTDSGLLHIWDVRRRKLLHSVHIGGGEVSVPAFSPDGRNIAVGTYGTGTVWLVGIDSGKIVDRARVSDLGCGSAAFSPDGRYLITPSTGGLITWPYDKGGTIHVFRVGHLGKSM